jgi:P27 family predicted phage terminase small subunit
VKRLSNRAKPLSLIKGNHVTKAEKERREKAEASLKGKVEDLLKVPAFLDSDAKKYYKRTLKLIGPEGTDLLCDADKDSLTTYAAALSILKQCQNEIKQKGILLDGKPNPALKLFENYSKIVKSFSSSFGLDPFSRSKLSTKKEGDAPPQTSAQKRFGDRL